MLRLRSAPLLAAALAVSCATPERGASRGGLPEDGPRGRARAIAEMVEWAELFVDAEEVRRLGLTREELEARPPATAAEQRAAVPVVEAGRAVAERCLPVLVDADGRRAPMEAYAAVFVAPDGRVTDARTSIDREKEADVDRCLTEVAGGWRFQPVAGGGLLLQRFHGTGPERIVEPRPQPTPEELAGYTKPQMKVRNCVQNAFRVPSKYSGLAQSVTVKFAVGRDGAVSRFRVLDSAPIPVAREIKRAVTSCEWIPGTDGAGNPTAIWVIIPLRFHGFPAG